MSTTEQMIRREMGPMFDREAGKPAVSFFDKAVLDPELSEQSGRPRYRSEIYIQKIPTAPDLVVRDVFQRAMMPEDIRDFPEEWERYQSQKREIENRSPLLRTLPGMDVASLQELEDLGVRDCEALLAYDGDIGDLVRFKPLAAQIMEISNGITRNHIHRGEREVLPVDQVGRQDGDQPTGDGGGVPGERPGGHPGGRPGGLRRHEGQRAEGPPEGPGFAGVRQEGRPGGEAGNGRVTVRQAGETKADFDLEIKL